MLYQAIDGAYESFELACTVFCVNGSRFVNVQCALFSCNLCEVIEQYW